MKLWYKEKEGKINLPSFIIIFKGFFLMEMVDLNNKSNDELIELTRNTEDKNLLRVLAEKVEVTFSGNTGVSKLKENILSKLEEDEEEFDPVIMKALVEKQKDKSPKKKDIMSLPKTALAKLNPREKGLTEAEIRAIVKAKALQLHRVRITNMDPADSALPAVLITVTNKYAGKVSKLIPFGEENNAGYHVPQIILKILESKTYNLRKEIKTKGSSFGVKQYKAVQMKKYNIEYLPDLTKEELESLGKDQKARNALDSD
jgi:hypothetical protein